MKFILNEDTYNETANKLAHEFYKYCVEKHVYIEECEGQFDSDDNLVISYEIYNGDWKHEHLRSRFLAQEFFFEKGYAIEHINQYEIGESDSDTYDAHYDIELEYSPLFASTKEDDDEIEVDLLNDKE